MKVRIDDTEFSIREDLPGTIHFVETDKRGRIVSVLETLLENVAARYGEEVAEAVTAYLDTPEHLAQILTDYGWTEVPGSPHLFNKKTITDVEFVCITEHDPLPAHWHHWYSGKAVDQFGASAQQLWKMLLPVVRR